MLIHSFAYDYTTNNKETYPQDFLEIMKRMLQNFKKILKKCFPGITTILIYLAGSNFLSYQPQKGYIVYRKYKNA